MTTRYLYVLALIVALIGFGLCEVLNPLQTDWAIRALVYSPATIGQDPHIHKIDIYTDYFSNLHMRDLPLIKQLRATHIIVSENWAADGTSVHHVFLEQLVTLELKLIVTFALPVIDDSVLRDNAKQSFGLLISEFSTERYAKLLYGFYIPVPPLDKMSDQDFSVYYNLVRELSQLIDEKVVFKPSPILLSGFPMTAKDAKFAWKSFPAVVTNAWILDIYVKPDPDGPLVDVMAEYLNSDNWNHNPVKDVIPMITTQSFDNNRRESNETTQDNRLKEIFTWLATNYQNQINVLGVAITEFSDEWWRSDLAAVGTDVEGCPNSNSYAHTPCGNVIQDGILSIEYTGMYRLRDRPLGFCVIAKKVAQTLPKLWAPTSTPTDLDMQVGVPVCTGLAPIVPWYVYPILAGLSFLVFVLLLVLPTPNPPKVTDRQLTYFVDDDLDRSYFAYAQSGTGPNDSLLDHDDDEEAEGRNIGKEPEDLIGKGNLGLSRSVDKDPENLIGKTNMGVSTTRMSVEKEPEDLIGKTNMGVSTTPQNQTEDLLGSLIISE